MKPLVAKPFHSIDCLYIDFCNSSILYIVRNYILVFWDLPKFLNFHATYPGFVNMHKQIHKSLLNLTRAPKEHHRVSRKQKSRSFRSGILLTFGSEVTQLLLNYFLFLATTIAAPARTAGTTARATPVPGLPLPSSAGLVSSVLGVSSVVGITVGSSVV